MSFNLDQAKTVLAQSNELSREGITLAMTNSKLRDTYSQLKAEVDTLSKEISDGCTTLDVMVKAATILSSVSEDCTNQVLKAITDVINKSLGVLFPDDPKTHPQYTLVLRTQNGVARAFNQSGTGLAQVISFLFTACLIDARKGRNIMVMDELLNGLHPSAKGIVRDIMLALSTRPHDPFQFVIVEYGVDIGKQYEVRKSGGKDGLSTVKPWAETSSEGYYSHVLTK